MLHPFRYLLFILSRIIFWTRYRIRVEGLEQAKKLPGPILLLPNHPGYIDPPLVLRTIWFALKPRAMLLETMFTNPLLYPLMKLLEAIRVPDLDRPSSKARARTEEAVREAIASLKAGRNVIMWPSGRIQRDGMEHLGAVRALTEIIQAVPNLQPVVIRTRGVWGSSFSFAYAGKIPSLITRMLQGVGWILANLLVFMPRRPVTITLEIVDRSELPELKREAINPWFERKYNFLRHTEDGKVEYIPEEPTFVPYHFLFGKRTHEFPPPPRAKEIDPNQITRETKAAIAEILEHRLGQPLTEEDLQADSNLERLGLDSMERMEISLEVEQRFGFTGDEIPSTVGELWALAQGMVDRGPVKPAPAAWFRTPEKDVAAIIPESTAPQAFVRLALENRQATIVADDLAGALTYERLLTGALLMANRFGKLQPLAPQGKNLGLMLPSSVACDLALFAIYLADRLPVLLNWTTGPGNLAHAARLTELKYVVTSRQFIDRTHIEVPGVEYLYLEDLRKDLGTFEKLWTLLRVRYMPKQVRKQVPAHNPDDTAVILFTSGSEKAPKAVPLTHRNLLTNQQGAIDALNVTRHDAILAFLPAFHSFGLSLTCMLPLVSGVRVVHHPDPTDANGLARKISAYQPTIVAGTPTFISYILDRATPEHLTSLKYIVIGAEKCPQELHDRCARMIPGAGVYEGYGITECSPVVSGNRPGANRPGTVGQPFPGVDVQVVDIETGEPLPTGQEGMLLVSGPTIFPGYLGYEGTSPFREMDGKRWYITGDLVRIDEDGYIHFSGRLKRFLKAAGEMISLPALEEPFAQRYPPTQEGPRVAVEGVEKDNGRRIVLFTTEEIDLREANTLLQNEGFRGVMRLDEVRKMDSLPTLGTGKTDYKVLRSQLQ